MDQHRGTSQFPLIPETEPVDVSEPGHPTPKVHRHRPPVPQPREAGNRQENDPHTKEQPPVHNSSAACLLDEQQFKAGIRADGGVSPRMKTDRSKLEEQPGDDCSPASQQIRQHRGGLRGEAGDVREPGQRAARQHAGNDRLDAAAGGFREAVPDRQQQTSSCVAPATSEAETTCIDGRVATLKGENDENEVDQAHGRVGKQHNAEALSDGRQHLRSPAAKQGVATAHKSDRGRAFAVKEQPLRNRAPAAAAEERPEKGSKPRKLGAEAGKAGAVAKPTRVTGNGKKPAAAARGGPPAHRVKGEKKQAKAGGNRATGPAAKHNALTKGAGQLPVEASQPDWLTDHSHAPADEVKASYKHRQ